MDEEVQKVRDAIIEFMFSIEGGGAKLQWLDELIFDSDSNWGFDPTKLAERIVMVMKKEGGG